MKITQKFIGIFTLLFMMIGANSCMKDVDELIDKINRTNGAILDAEIALPLINTRLTLDDVIEQNASAYIKKDKDELLMLAYRGEIFSQSAEQFVEIENQTFESILTLSPSQQAFLASNGSITLQFTEYMDYQMNDMEVDSMWLKVCTNQMRVRSTFKHDLEFTFVLPDVTKDGIPFSRTFNETYDVFNIDVSDNANLSGYRFDMSTGPKTHSQVRVDMKVKLTYKTGNPILPSDKITANLFMFYNEFSKFFGYVGTENFLSDVDSFNFDVLEKLKSGGFSLEDPRFKLIIRNSLGIPIEAKVLELATIGNGGKQALTGVPSPLPVPVPGLSQAGLTLTDSIVLNKQTSNIATLINSRPTKFLYGFNVKSNPNGKQVRNFVLDTSKITFEVDIEIPLHGSMNDIVLDESMDVDLGLDEEIDFLERVDLRLVLDNGFPMGADVQVYLMDTSDVVLDSLLVNTTSFIPAAVVDAATGKVISSTKGITDISYSKARIELLERTRKIRVKALLNTSKVAGAIVPVKIFSDYGMGVKFGIQAKIRYNQTF